MERLLTIGVYGWDASRWLGALRSAGCDQILDIRARRGVRGRDYAFANRVRLEAALAEAGIAYLHLPELAPLREGRDAQATADRAAGIRKGDRVSLGPAFIEAYGRDVLDHVDWAVVAARISGVRPTLMCVERVPSACHRSLASARFAVSTGVAVEDLLP